MARKDDGGVALPPAAGCRDAAVRSRLTTDGDGQRRGLSPPRAPLGGCPRGDGISGRGFAGTGLRLAFVSRQFLVHAYGGGKNIKGLKVCCIN